MGILEARILLNDAAIYRSDWQYINAGLILGGTDRDCQEWKGAIKRWVARLDTIVAGVQGPLSLSMVFLVPGNVWQPDFAGAKVTAFRAKYQEVELQIVLPRTPPVEIEGYLTLTSLSALSELEAWAGRRKRLDQIAPFRSLLASV